MSVADAPVVVITGAGGFIGERLVRRFKAAGWEVRALVHSSPASTVPDVRYVPWSLLDPLDVATLRDARCVVHAAAAMGGDATVASRQNLDGSLQVLQECRAQGVPHAVFLSSMSAHPDAGSSYGRDKLSVQRAWIGPGALVIRPGLVLGDRGLFGRISRFVMDHRVVPVVGGGQLVQTVHVDDLAAAIVTAVDRGLDGTLTIAEPTPVAFHDLLAEVARVSGANARLIPVPYQAVAWGLGAARRMRLRLPVSEENLLGLRGLRSQDVTADLARLGVEIRDYRASVAAIMRPTTS